MLLQRVLATRGALAPINRTAFPKFARTGPNFEHRHRLGILYLRTSNIEHRGHLSPNMESTFFEHQTSKIEHWTPLSFSGHLLLNIEHRTPLSFSDHLPPNIEHRTQNAPSNRTSNIGINSGSSIFERRTSNIGHLSPNMESSFFERQTSNIEHWTPSTSTF